MSGKLLIEWRHSLCAEISQKRYMTPDGTRRAHVELANIFFNHEIDEYDDTSSNKTQNSGILHLISFSIKSNGNVVSILWPFVSHS